MKKKYLLHSVILALLSIFIALPVTVSAQTPYSITYNEENYPFMDTPQVIDDKLYFPMREVLEWTDIYVDYYAPTNESETFYEGRIELDFYFIIDLHDYMMYDYDKGTVLDNPLDMIKLNGTYYISFDSYKKVATVVYDSYHYSPDEYTLDITFDEESNTIIVYFEEHYVDYYDDYDDDYYSQMSQEEEKLLQDIKRRMNRTIPTELKVSKKGVFHKNLTAYVNDPMYQYFWNNGTRATTNIQGGLLSSMFGYNYFDSFEKELASFMPDTKPVAKDNTFSINIYLDDAYLTNVWGATYEEFVEEAKEFEEIYGHSIVEDDEFIAFFVGYYYILDQQATMAFEIVDIDEMVISINYYVHGSPIYSISEDYIRK